MIKVFNYNALKTGTIVFGEDVQQRKR